jgi:HD-GYP domain-containing protein (c-di-GMP phosphodiesterase class II)
MRRRSGDWTGEARDPDENAVWEAQRDVIEAASDTLAAQESSDELVQLCADMGKELGIGELEEACLLSAAQVHDIGRVTLPREVLDKPGPLSSGDWSLMCLQTTIGERILRSVPEMSGVARIVRSSHERFDGRGYPDGLRGNQIPLASRIVLCAEAYEAMQCERPHRAAYSAHDAMGEMRASAGKQFDPEVVAALEAALAEQQGPLAGIRRALSPR